MIYILLWGSRKLGVMQTLAKRKNAPSFTLFFIKILVSRSIKKIVLRIDSNFIFFTTN
jgi:hypothetical protein